MPELNSLEIDRNLKTLRASAQVLGISPPLFMDHLEREAAYYLEKIGYGSLLG